MLTGRGKRMGDDSPLPARSYLVECVRSATTIIAIFDLFCRTFTMNYCVLSLAYRVYTAAYVFLPQVQVSSDEQQAMRKLEYCCQCLSQVKTISPVINSALNIKAVLDSTGLNAPSPRQLHLLSSPTRSDRPISGLMYYNPVNMSRQMPLSSYPLFQPTMNHLLGTESMAMHPDIFEIMSTLEPLSVRVGAVSGPDN